MRRERWRPPGVGSGSLQRLRRAAGSEAAGRNFPELGSEACRLFSDGAVGRRRSPSKSPEARIMPAARVSVTFRKLAFQRSEDSASLRVPRHQPPLKTRIFLQLKPSQSLASSGNPSHPSPTLSKRSVTSNNPNRPGLRLFPKVSSARSPPL